MIAKVVCDGGTSIKAWSKGVSNDINGSSK